MKVLRNAILKDGTGEITLLPELDEDMWHAYNLIATGDCIRATTLRKVKSESTTGSVESTKKRITLCIQVLDVEFDTEGCALRVKGKNVEENKHVKRGQHHTIDMELQRKFTLIKPEWDSLALERIRECTDLTRSADLAAIVMAEGKATLSLITGSMTLVRARIDVAIPRKRPMNASQRDKATIKFFNQIAEAIRQHVDFDIVKAVVVASPGFIKDDFLKHMFETATRNGDKLVLDNRSKFVAVHSSSGYMQDLQEILQDQSVLSRLADTKAAAEVAALDSFYKMLAQDEERAAYGPIHVQKALDAAAIDTLLLSDGLLRAKSVAERKRWVGLVEEVKDNAGTVFIFSSLHVSGQQLDKLSGTWVWHRPLRSTIKLSSDTCIVVGVAAILRFPLPDLDAKDNDDSSDDE
eukprot:TRINITY_DN6989_c0_g1_i1.p1 TRINITY_DN6989_c0_g1~~TRINITY_DN6989_c0_g1_i1.p1  ORF type:complete len:409 (+),score=83.49 TRINITY_DN6989_c0_g1_i1:47-1273(+)